MAFPAPPAPAGVVVPDVKLKSVSHFVSLVTQGGLSSRTVRAYRGHGKTSYVLQPSLYREKGHSRSEKDIFRELIRLHPDEFINDQSAFDRLVRMQHFSLETRLLDVSFNPLVALYFASRSNVDADGHVIVLDVKKEVIKYFDSDTISCLPNLGSLSAKERDTIRGFNTDEDLKQSEEGLRLLHFIKSEKPYFLDKIQIGDLKSIKLVRPKQNNRRILAQQGAFFILGLNRTIVSGHNDITISRFIVPKKLKSAFVDQLDILNIHGSSMFPEIESAAKYVMSKL